jgi:hypothetical protein
MDASALPRLVLPTLLLLAACGADQGTGSPPAVLADASVPEVTAMGEGPVGGSRLEAVLAQAADGTGHFLHWQDTGLDVPCEFLPLHDGALRCLPTGPAMAAVQAIYYTDAACTVPVALLHGYPSSHGDCPQPRFASRAGTGAACDPRPDYYRVGERLPPQVVYQRAQEGCAAAAIPQGAGLLGVFRVTTLALTELVAGALTAGPAAEGIALTTLVAEDGSRMVTSLRDVGGGFDCAVEESSDGPRCLPTDRVMVAGFFADAACSKPAGMAQSCLQGQRPSIPFGFELAFVQGRTIVRSYRAGERLATSFTQVGGTCVAQAAWAGVFAIGGELPASTFVPGTTELVTRPSGLVQTVERAGGQSLSRPRTLRSTEYGGFACLLAATGDGVVRCLPPEGVSGGHFSDQQCTTPLIVGEQPAFTVLDRDRCPPQARVLSGGARHLGGVYAGRPGACALVYDQTASVNKFEYHAVGPELPPDRFVALPLVRR